MICIILCYFLELPNKISLALLFYRSSLSKKFISSHNRHLFLFIILQNSGFTKILYKRMKNIFCFLKKKKHFRFLYLPLLRFLYLPLLKSSRRSMFLVTVLAVNWSCTIRLKRNLSFFTAICTFYRVHFSGWATKASFASIGSIFSVHFILFIFYFILFIFYRNINSTAVKFFSRMKIFLILKNSYFRQNIIVMYLILHEILLTIIDY